MLGLTYLLLVVFVVYAIKKVFNKRNHKKIFPTLEKIKVTLIYSMIGAICYVIFSFLAFVGTFIYIQSLGINAERQLIEMGVKSIMSMTFITLIILLFTIPSQMKKNEKHIIK